MSEQRVVVKRDVTERVTAGRQGPPGPAGIATAEVAERILSAAIAAGTVVAENADGELVVASSEDTTALRTLGFLTIDGVTGARVDVRVAGIIDWPVGGLTADKPVFLAAAGGVTHSVTGTHVIPLGVAVSATQIQVHVGKPLNPQDWYTGKTLGVAHGGTGADTAAGARTSLELGNAATKDVGTTPETVAAGDHDHSGVYEPADSTILKDADIGVSVQAYSLILQNTTAAFTSADETKLDGIQAGAQVNNISDIDAADLTDAGDSALHYHAADRDRGNHTGTQAGTTVTFDNTGTQFLSGNMQTLGVEIDGLLGDIGSALDAINGEVI